MRKQHGDHEPMAYDDSELAHLCQICGAPVGHEHVWIPGCGVVECTGCWLVCDVCQIDHPGQVSQSGV